jgi:hypothetical protein
VLAELSHRSPHSDEHGVAVRCQHLVQVGAVQRDARTDLAP